MRKLWRANPSTSTAGHRGKEEQIQVLLLLLAHSTMDRSEGTRRSMWLCLLSTLMGTTVQKAYIFCICKCQKNLKIGVPYKQTVFNKPIHLTALASNTPHDIRVLSADQWCALAGSEEEAVQISISWSIFWFCWRFTSSRWLLEIASICEIRSSFQTSFSVSSFQGKREALFIFIKGRPTFWFWHVFSWVSRLWSSPNYAHRDSSFGMSLFVCTGRGD